MCTAHDTNARIRTRRFIFTCKHCKTTKAIDYTSTSTPKGEDKWGVMRWTEPKFTRIVDGRVRDISHDAMCSCGRYYTGTAVKGTKSNHRCDARCVNSKGPNCECSCGGENHGKAYL